MFNNNSYAPTHSFRDQETALSNFWSPGVRGRPQRVPSADGGGRRLLLLPPPALVQLRLLLVLYLNG